MSYLSDEEKEPIVMVVEDDPATRRLFSFLLSNSGYHVIEAEDGISALQKYKEQPCDLIITDLMMPNMNGLELVKALRENQSSVYIIMITALGMSEMKQKAWLLGTNEFIEKPFEFEELERRVRAFFET